MEIQLVQNENGWMMRQLVPLAGGQSDFVPFLCLPGRETEFARCVVDWLAGHRQEYDSPRGNTGLYLHGVYEPGHGNRECRWADPKTGLSPEVWSEGLGWYALVMVETLADLPKNHAKRSEMEDIFRRLAAGLKRTQDPKSGRWFQVVDKGDRPGNWTDTSGSTCSPTRFKRALRLACSIRLSTLGRAQGYQGIIGNAKINDKGLVDIYSACDGVGVQVSYDRYISYKKSVNAKEAVAGFLWATAIVERLNWRNCENSDRCP